MKRGLAALHPIATCRRGTGDICRYRVREREFVPGSSLPAVFQVAARRPQMALDWHSSRSCFAPRFNQFSLSKTLLDDVVEDDLHIQSGHFYLDCPLIMKFMISRCLSHLTPI